MDALCNSLLYGPTPVAEALSALRRSCSTGPADADVRGERDRRRSPACGAMLGDFDEARELLRARGGGLEELGLELARAR